MPSAASEPTAKTPAPMRNMIRQQIVWTKRAAMPTPRDHHAIGVVDGKLYAIGGRINGRHDRSIGVERRIRSGKRTAGRRAAALPTVRSGIAAAIVSAAKSSSSAANPTAATHNEVESYDPAQNRWQHWAPMPTARHGLGAAVIGNSIYVIAGGPKPGATFSSVNEVFTP